MAETRYQDLSADDRRDALQVAERGSNHKAHLLEKDITLMEQADGAVRRDRGARQHRGIEEPLMDVFAFREVLDVASLTEARSG